MNDEVFIFLHAVADVPASVTVSEIILPADASFGKTTWLAASRIRVNSLIFTSLSLVSFVGYPLAFHSPSALAAGSPVRHWL